MIPLPQSPWTLAIAELLGLRLAARGSGAQPADLLANLLPKRESPPEGWLEHFLASTPVPGVISEPGAGGSSMTFPSSAAPPIPSGIPPHPPQGKGPTDQHFGTLWEHTLKCMALAAQSEGGIPGCEPSHKQAVLGSGSESCAACGGAPAPGALGSVFGGAFPPFPPSSATMDGCFTPNPGGAAAGKASESGSFFPTKPPFSTDDSTFDELPHGKEVPHGKIGDDLHASIELTIDFRKFAEDLLKLAKQVAQDVVGRHQVRIGAQTKANGCWGRR